MEARLERWAAVTETPLMVAAVAFFFAFAIPIAGWTSVPEPAVIACEVVVWVTWGLFIVDYVVRLVLSEHKWDYVRRHWYDLIIIALPVLRPLRLLRLVTFLRVVNARASVNLYGKVGLYVASGAVLLSVVGALAVLDAERTAEGSTITNLGDAFWWVAITIATVGYGDYYPVTPVGRAVAIGVMVCGIAVLGSVTAMLAAWLVSRVSDDSAETQELLAEVRGLRAEVAELKGMLSGRGDSGNGEDS